MPQNCRVLGIFSLKKKNPFRNVIFSSQTCFCLFVSDLFLVFVCAVASLAGLLLPFTAPSTTELHLTSHPSGYGSGSWDSSSSHLAYLTHDPPLLLSMEVKPLPTPTWQEASTFSPSV